MIILGYICLSIVTLIVTILLADVICKAIDFIGYK